MKRTTLLVCTTALAAVALLSARPASAVPVECDSITLPSGMVIPPDPSCNSETVPEPGTILGTMLIGSAMVWKKYNKATKA